MALHRCTGKRPIGETEHGSKEKGEGKTEGQSKGEGQEERANRKSRFSHHPRVGEPMHQGSYKRINFAAFRVAKFNPYFFSGTLCAMNGCGASTLALLTGINPLEIGTRKGNDWTDKFMLAFLRKEKFKVIKLSVKNVTNYKQVEYPIGPGHVVMLATKLIKGQYSWMILHNNILYHNFDVTPLRLYEFINHPIRAAYLLQHPNWMAIPATKKVIAARRRRFGLPPPGRMAASKNA